VNCEPLLKYSKIDKFFDYVATKEVAIGKVEKFNIILEKYNVSKDETVFVTDTLGDLMESKSAGIPTIAVTYGAHNRSFFMRESHSNLVSIVDSVEELGRMIV
jgi:phosphoglycolate phosphatase-like HAD superfamily hydrolase